MRPSICLILVSASTLSACAYDDGHGWREGGYAYHGRHYGGPARRAYEGELHGPGVGQLDEWLKGTREGQAIVTLGFREAGYGYVSEEVADRANIWFRLYADQNHDMVITDPEIRTALVAAAGPYLRR
jgi:hypothetical protein